MPYTDQQKKSHIREVQGYLHQLSRRDNRIPNVIPDGIYGAETVAAVRAFQQIYNLPVTGEVDRVTWDEIVKAYNAIFTAPSAIIVFPSPQYVLQKGDEGTLVYFVQVMLHALSKQYGNLPPVGVNGKFDDRTEMAVRSVQQRGGLPQTGNVNRDTWNMLALGVNEMKHIS